MNILFLTLLDFDSLEERNIYTDLLREFHKNGHNLYVVSPVERRKKIKTHLLETENLKILKLKIGNVQKTNYIEKGLSLLYINNIFIKGIKTFFKNIKFDLILYTTPPIMITNAITYVKNRDKAKTYLLLKDIFPQNAVDLRVLSPKSIIYKHYRNEEKKLYAISDYIGCMSQKNVDYIIEHNPEVDVHKVEVCPNSIEVFDYKMSYEEKNEIRKRYNIPINKTVYVYGGNIGRPQGIDFLIECLKSQQDNRNVFFLIIGNGTDFFKLEKYVKTNHPQNVKLVDYLPKEEFDKVVKACDVGMLFLDYRFTIPNFPSRILTYMQARKPVLAVTDSATDIGEIIVKNGFGWCWCESNKIEQFEEAMEKSYEIDLSEMGNNAYNYLLNNYTTQSVYEIIMRSIL